jgi:hypothetical protein
MTTLDEAISPSHVLDSASWRDWAAVLGALLGAFMAVLNIQITNASLLYIEGGIGTGSTTERGFRRLISSAKSS